MPALRVRRLESGGAFKYALLLPAVIWVVAFTFLPLISVIRYSFSSYVMGEGITGFVGFANYVDVLTSDQFWHSILVTVIFVVVAVPIELVLGFLAAWLVNLGAPGTRTFRTIIGSPLFTLEVAIGYLGVTFFTDQGGLIAVPLAALGIHVPWMSTAYGGIAGAIILDVWRWTSFIFIIVLAGLAGIPSDLYDAAVLDAKSHWQVMWHLAIPLAWPVITIAVLAAHGRMPEGLRHSVRADVRRARHQHRALQRHGLSDDHSVLRLRQGLGDGNRVPDHGLGRDHAVLQADAQEFGIGPGDARDGQHLVDTGRDLVPPPHLCCCWSRRRFSPSCPSSGPRSIRSRRSAKHSSSTRSFRSCSSSRRSIPGARCWPTRRPRTRSSAAASSAPARRSSRSSWASRRPTAWLDTSFLSSSNDIALWFLSQRVLPPAVVLVPFYLLLVYLRLIDTWTGSDPLLLGLQSRLRRRDHARHLSRREHRNRGRGEGRGRDARGRSSG